MVVFSCLSRCYLKYSVKKKKKFKNIQLHSFFILYTTCRSKKNDVICPKSAANHSNAISDEGVKFEQQSKQISNGNLFQISCVCVLKMLLCQVLKQELLLYKVLWAVSILGLTYFSHCVYSEIRATYE